MKPYIPSCEEEARYLAAYDASKYQNPAVTADIALFGKRRGRAFPAAYPPGRVPIQGLLCPARRVYRYRRIRARGCGARAFEETGIKGLAMHECGVLSEPGRDPRQRVISVVYWAAAEKSAVQPAAGDDAAAAEWFRFSDYSCQGEPGSRVYRYTLSGSRVFHIALREVWENGILRYAEEGGSPGQRPCRSLPPGLFGLSARISAAGRCIKIITAGRPAENHQMEGNNMETKVVILAAGEGTRMKSAKPKVLHSCAGKSLVAWVAEAAEAVCSRPVVVVGSSGEAVREELSEEKFDFALQAQRLGSGHAVMAAKEQIAGSEYTVVLAGDMPLIRGESIQSLVNSARGRKVFLHAAHRACAKPQGLWKNYPR